MGVSVTREGPYFAGGQTPSNTTNMKFSQMRDVFKLDLKGSTASGSSATSIIKASELRRDTDPDSRDPIVPDCVRNEDIASKGSNALKNNWKVSQMRDSIKRFWATQSGTDINFKMGRYNGSEGIDWGGYGSSGRDSQASGNGNLTKNVQKYIKITGTCGANDSGSWGGQGGDPGAGTWTQGAPAAQLNPVVPARNVRIWVYGSILGAGGEGGYDSRGYERSTNTQWGADPGTPGGNALSVNHNGNKTWIRIKSGSARIWGGGGGGEQGRNGNIPQPGLCSKEWQTSGCGSAPGCASPAQSISSWSGGCCTWYEFCNGGWLNVLCNEHCGGYQQYRICREEQVSTIPTQGIGGRGGDGVGYNQSKTNGQNGTNPSEKCPTCPSGWGEPTATNTYPNICTTQGSTGGDGGDWGQAGESTTAGNATRQPQPSNGGQAGRAVCGNNFTLFTENLNGNTVKGTYTTLCDGGIVDPPDAPTVNLTVSGSGPWTLSWTTTNSPTAVSGSANPPDSAWNPSTPSSGSIQVNPSTTTTYNINVSNNGGQAGDSVTISNAPTIWTTSRAASWQNEVTFNRYQGSGQAQIISTLPQDGTTGTTSYTMNNGARYRMIHGDVNVTNGWKNPSTNVKNLSDGNAQQPVVRIVDSNKKLQVEDGSNDVTHPDGRSWIDYQITTNLGSFSYEGYTDYQLHITNLHSRNNNRNWIASSGGTTWYKTVSPFHTDWGSFMREYSVYVSTNDSMVGSHSYNNISVNIPANGNYKLAWQADNAGTIIFNGNTYNHSGFGDNNVKTEDLNLTAGTYTMSFSVTNGNNPGQNNWADNPGGIAIRLWSANSNNYGANIWSTRDNIAGTTTGGTVSDQAITFWDGDGEDANETFRIVSKDSTISEARFVNQGRQLRIIGGGNITLRLETNDRTNMAGVGLDSIEIWNCTWNRISTTGTDEKTIATSGGDIIYTR